MRGNEELIKNFYPRVKSAVDKGWPLDPNVTEAERDNQQNQKNAEDIEFTVRGLKPNGLKRKAQEEVEDLKVQNHDGCRIEHIVYS